MEYFFTLLLFILAIYMTYRNIKLLKRMRKLKQYTPISNKIFENEAEAVKELELFFDQVDDLEFKQKTNILLLNSKAHLRQDFSKHLDYLDLNIFFYDKNKLNKKKPVMNSDSFFWLLVAIINLRSDHMTLDTLKEKIIKTEAMKNYLYYELAIQMIEAFKEPNKDNLTFFKEFLQGSYAQYMYDKHLIVLFKRLVASVLKYFNQLSKDDEVDLKFFKTTKVGKYIYDELKIQ